MAIPSGCQAPLQDYDVQYRAAIVDQLYILEHNPTFINEVTQILESHGFTVDLWQGWGKTNNQMQENPRAGQLDSYNCLDYPNGEWWDKIRKATRKVKQSGRTTME